MKLINIKIYKCKMHIDYYIIMLLIIIVLINLKNHIMNYNKNYSLISLMIWHNKYLIVLILKKINY